MTLITTVGINLDTDIMDGSVAVPASWYLAIGEGVTAQNIADTALEDPVMVRLVGSSSQPSANTNQFEATFTADASYTITECGLFSALVAGVCFARDTTQIGAIGLGIGDQIILRFQISRS